MRRITCGLVMVGFLGVMTGTAGADASGGGLTIIGGTTGIGGAALANLTVTSRSVLRWAELTVIFSAALVSFRSKTNLVLS